MGKINKTKILHTVTIKTGFLLCLLLAGFFGFGSLKVALADCSYQVNAVTSKNPAGVNENFQITATTIRSGSPCNDPNIYAQLYYKTSSGSWQKLEGKSAYAGFYTDTSPAHLGSIAVASIPINFTSDYLTDPSYQVSSGVYDFRVEVDTTVVHSTLGVSKEVYVSVTGQSNSNGQVSGNVSFNPAPATYSENDQVTVTFNPDSQSDLKNAANGAKLAMKVFANGTQAGLADPLDPGSPPSTKVSITAANGFKNGLNPIRVELWLSGTNVQVASVTTSINVYLASAANSPSITISPSSGSVAAGGTVTVTWANLAGLSGAANVVVEVNGGGSMIYPISQNSASITVSAANGFNMTGNESINAWVSDASGNQIANGPDVTTALTVGAAGTGGGQTCTPACVSPQTCQNGTCQTASGMAGNSSSKLYNPLPEEDLTHVFLLIMQGFLAIIGIWAVIFLFVGGFQMVMAAGNEEMYTKAKKTIIWAVLGLIIALLSFSVIAIVQDLLQSNIQPVPTGFSRTINWL